MIPKLTDEPGAIELAAQIRAGKLSPLEAVDAAIARIEALDGPINAVVVRDFDRARETARGQTTSGPDQPLFGVPMTVKESFDVAGLPTTWGFAEHTGYVARRDSKVVRELRKAGVVILGKTNVPPALADWQSTNPVYGRTANPHDLSRSPGGSSGGSAAAVASGMVPCEFGTDIGGSVRVPAHFCGIWSHKSSWGAISKHGHDHPAFAGNDGHDGALSIAGPLARNADDLALLVERTASFPLRRSKDAVTGARFLLVLDWPDSPVDDAVRGPIEAALAQLEQAGIAVDRKPRGAMPDFAQAQADYLRMLNVAMARGAPGPDGQRATASDWFDLLDAQAQCEVAWEEVFAGYCFVLAPPAPVLAVPQREGRVFDGTITINGRDENSAAALAWAGIATFPNLPSTVLPVGESGGLPCGMQVIGPRWADLDCIAAAKVMGEILGVSSGRRQLLRWHVWLGWLIGVPLVLWTVTGLVMVARPIEVVRGTDLRAELAPLPPIAAIAPQLAPGQAESLTLRQTALGPRWILAGRDESRAALDPRSGLALPPLTRAQAASAARAYRQDNARIEALALTPRDRPPLDLRQPRPAWGVTFADGARFYIDAETGELIAVRTRWWRVFDFMWGLHIMDLQTREDTHHPILILFAALAAAGSVLGCVLMIRKYSRPRVRG